jgi:hypothetical protein
MGNNKDVIIYTYVGIAERTDLIKRCDFSICQQHVIQ